MAEDRELAYDVRPNGVAGYSWEVYDKKTGAILAEGAHASESGAIEVAAMEMLLVGNGD